MWHFIPLAHYLSNAHTSLGPHFQPHTPYVTRYGTSGASGVEHKLCPHRLLPTVTAAMVDLTTSWDYFLSTHVPVLVTITLNHPLPINISPPSP